MTHAEVSSADSDALAQGRKELSDGWKRLVALHVAASGADEGMRRARRDLALLLEAFEGGPTTGEASQVSASAVEGHGAEIAAADAPPSIRKADPNDDLMSIACI